MGFLPVPSDDQLSADAVAARNRRQDAHPGPIRPLDRALLNSVPVFEAYAGWLDVREELEPLVGERAVTLLSLAIAESCAAPYCVAEFRGALEAGGDDPDAPQVTEAERLLLDWGRAVASDEVPADLAARVEAAFQPRTRAVLAGYAGLTIAVAAFSRIAGLEPDTAP